MHAKIMMMKSQGCALHIVSLRPLGIPCVHLRSTSTHHSIFVNWVGVETISVVGLCEGFPFPTAPRPDPRRRANTQTNSRGVFYATVPVSAGCWSHSGLATVSSLGHPTLASLLPKNERRNPLLRGVDALQTVCAPEAHPPGLFFASSAPMSQ